MFRIAPPPLLRVYYFASDLMSPIIAKLGNVATCIVNLKNFVFHTHQFLMDLTLEANNNQTGLAIRHFGYFAGNVALLYAPSKATVQTIVEATDKKPKGRKPYSILTKLVGAEFSGIASTLPAPTATIFRKHLINFFNQEKMDEIANIIYEKTILVFESKKDKTLAYKHLQDITSEIIFSTLAQGVFGLNKFSSEFLEIINKIGKLLSNPVLSHFTSLAWISPEFIKSRRRYQLLVSDLYKQMFDTIYAAITTNPKAESANFLLFLLIQDIKEEKRDRKISKAELIKLLNKPLIRALPLLLLGSQSLIEALNQYIRILVENSVKVQRPLQTYLCIDSVLPTLFNKSAQRIPSISIRRFFSEDCAFVIEGQRYYFPANTTVFIGLASSQRKYYNVEEKITLSETDHQNCPSVFSEGTRACPTLSRLTPGLFGGAARALSQNFILHEVCSGQFSISNKIY